MVERRNISPRKALYISYNGLTEPIVRSQVIPYLAGLSKKGNMFCLITYEKKRLTRIEKAGLRADLEAKVGSDSAIRWFPLRYHKRPTVPATILDIGLGFFLSFYLILRYGIDIVHARAIVAAMAGYPASKLLGRKFIFDTRGIDSEEYVDAGSWRRGGLKHRFVGWAERMILNGSDHVVVLTRRFLDILKKDRRLHLKAVSVIPCAVDTSLFAFFEKKDADLSENAGLKDNFVFVYSGSLGTWYMFDAMLEFFRTAKDKVKNARLLILTQTSGGFVEQALRKARLDPRDVVVKSIDYSEVKDYLAMADVGISFIKPVFSKLSSSPVKFGEYLACGLPVLINRDIGDTDDMVRAEKIGAVVNGFEISEYERALEGLLGLMKDPGLRIRCRKAAEKHLSLASAVEEYEHIYEGLSCGSKK